MRSAPKCFARERATRSPPPIVRRKSRRTASFTLASPFRPRPYASVHGNVHDADSIAAEPTPDVGGRHPPVLLPELSLRDRPPETRVGRFASSEVRPHHISERQGRAEGDWVVRGHRPAAKGCEVPGAVPERRKNKMPPWVVLDKVPYAVPLADVRLPWRGRARRH